MSVQAIAYPFSFLDRPADRLLLQSLGTRNIPPDKAKLMLYRIWADFATGGTDRREVSPDPSRYHTDRHVRLIEIFCEWAGAPGALVTEALAAGFLEIQHKDGKAWLVCQGFFPINSGWSGDGMQDKRKGAFARASNLQQKKAQADAADHLELLKRVGSLDAALSDDRAKAALVLLHRITRALNLPRMDGEGSAARFISSADAILSETQEPQIQQVLMWMISKRRDPSMPKDVATALMAWADLAATARREMP